MLMLLNFKEKIKKCFKKALLIILIAFFNISPVLSQQTIINLPSSEVLPQGNIILKESTRFRPSGSDGYTSITPTIITGIGHGLELSVGVGSTIDKDFNTNVKGDIGLKKVIFLGSSTRLTVGGSITPSFMTSVTPDTFTYAHVTQRIKKTRTSLTAGAYMNGQQHFLNTGGVAFGIDQVLIPNKLRLVFDWMSGEQNYGRMGVGLKYRPIPTLSVTSAVIIPNKDSESISFNISVSKNISIDEIKQTKRRVNDEKENSL